MKATDTSSFPQANSPQDAGSNGTSNAAERAVETVADNAGRSIDKTREFANNTFDQLANAVESARKSAVPAIEKISVGAESMARRSVDLARDKSRQVRDQAERASAQTSAYVREEPLKSMLFAVAAGAVLAWLLTARRDR